MRLSAAGGGAEVTDKRDDYFAAGTQVVWDVDTQAECIHVYKTSEPKRPVTYNRGEIAEAEPAARLTRRCRLDLRMTSSSTLEARKRIAG